MRALRLEVLSTLDSMSENDQNKRYDDKRNFVAKLKNGIRIFRCSPEDLSHESNFLSQIQDISKELVELGNDVDDFSRVEDGEEVGKETLEEVFNESKGFFGINEKDEIIAFTDLQYHGQEAERRLTIISGIMVRLQDQDQGIGSNFFQLVREKLFFDPEFDNHDIGIFTTNSKMNHLVNLPAECKSGFREKDNPAPQYTTEEVDIEKLWEDFLYDTFCDEGDYECWSVLRNSRRAGSPLDKRNIQKIYNPMNGNPEMGVVYKKTFPAKNLSSSNDSKTIKTH